MFGSVFMKVFRSHRPSFHKVKKIKRCLSLEPLENRFLLAVISGNVADINNSLLTSPAIPTTGEISSAVDVDIEKLNSNPNSIFSIYLDFDGHVTANTNWNTIYNGGADIVTPRFTLDGNVDKASFSVAEKTAIYEIWLRVSEDYIPFDVNVTTVEPPMDAFLNGRAQRVVIGGKYSDWFGSATGGISWVGTFTSKSDIPNFVFSESLNGNIKNIAEVVSHETGHALGLNHKGNSQISDQQEYFEGANGWAPIMGASYYQELTQWSKGEYVGANNTADELQIITTQNGFGYRDDDYADSFIDATLLNIANGMGNLSGLIEKNTDVDFFFFESDGSPLNFFIGGLTGVTNLDVLVTVYSEDLQPICVYNPSDSLYVEFTFAEEAGRYFLSVEGTGLETDWSGIYSDYGSLGAYVIQVGEPESLVVTTLDDSVANDGLLSLREAVLLASDRTSILFDDSLDNGTIFLTEGEILLNRRVIIDASLNGGMTIDAQENSRIFEVTGNATLKGLTLTRGGKVQSGAAIYNNNQLSLIDCVVTENVAVDNGNYLVGGGALFNAKGGVATLNGCMLIENIGNYGGAIYNAGTLSMTDTTLVDSTSWQRNGGAVYNEGCLTSNETLFSNNNAFIAEGQVAGGGAVYNSDNGVAFFIKTQFKANSATFGGAIFNFGQCTVEDSVLDDNVAKYYRGGGIYNYADLTVINTVFRNNIAANPGNLMVGGGAIYNTKNSTAQISQSLFYGNTGYFGGAVVNAGSMFITASTLTKNNAAGVGGGAILNANTLSITNSILVDNTSAGSYPDIYPYQGETSGSFNVTSFVDWNIGTNNIQWNGLPLFENPDEDDFIPIFGSQAIDAGSNDLVVTTMDLAGSERIVNKIVDIGAFEYTHHGPIKLETPTIITGNNGIFVSYGANRHEITWSPSENASGYELAYSSDDNQWKTIRTNDTKAIVTSLSYGDNIVYRVRALGTESYADSEWSMSRTFNVCPMDINGDGDISGADRVFVMSHWFSEKGDNNYRHYCDINGDGDISNSDLSYLISNWLSETGDEGLVYPRSLAVDIVFGSYDSSEPIEQEPVLFDSIT
ncbi:MAG: hypothetical protein IKE69_13310 [Thermoguttaceae bacterium]|nr:hypothetical protein [Thermoguttaceae bacterium]